MFGVLGLIVIGCQSRPPGAVRRPTEAQVAAALPNGAAIEEIVHADLTDDGREEVLVAANVPFGNDRIPTAVVLALDSSGQYAPAAAHGVVGDGWIPIQVGRPDARTPVLAIFAARGGSGAYLDFLVVQHVGLLQVTLERDGLLKGSVRIVSEGLLVTSGDVDWLYRWGSGGWRVEELASQYLPPLPPDTLVVGYVADPVHGPRVLGPRVIRARAGQSLFLRRMNRGEPSRILMSGVELDSFPWRQDASILLAKPGRLEVTIESPAYSDRVLRIVVQVGR